MLNAVAIAAGIGMLVQRDSILDAMHRKRRLEKPISRADCATICGVRHEQIDFLIGAVGQVSLYAVRHFWCWKELLGLRIKNAAMKNTFEMPLPKSYDITDVLSFHGRDTLNIAEQVSRSGIRKGILLADVPTVIDIEFDEKLTHAHCSIHADGEIDAELHDQAREVCSSILGLRLAPEDFLAFAAKDPVFGPLVKRQRGLRVVQSASIFEALTWAVIGQQINVAFAISLRRTFIRQAGRQHSSGLWCYPAAADAARISVEQLTSRQFSKSKAETLLRLANLVATSALDLVVSESNTLEKITEALLSVKGIGPWTVNYALLRGYAHADCSLHGDVAVRTAIHNLIGGDARPDIVAAEQFLKRYSPHRTMAAAHLWASLKKTQSF